MIFLPIIGLAFSIWGVATQDPSSFWFAWCLALAVANVLLLIREVAS